MCLDHPLVARVVELVDTQVSEACAVRCSGSSPLPGTILRSSAARSPKAKEGNFTQGFWRATKRRLSVTLNRVLTALFDDATLAFNSELKKSRPAQRRRTAEEKRDPSGRIGGDQKSEERVEGRAVVAGEGVAAAGSGREFSPGTEF